MGYKERGWTQTIFALNTGIKAFRQSLQKAGHSVACTQKVRMKREPENETLHSFSPSSVAARSGCDWQIYGFPNVTETRCKTPTFQDFKLRNTDPLNVI